MFSFHKPKIYRSVSGCCICRAKSSSSRFTDSKKYEAEFERCFRIQEKRSGEICNACVLLVKRWKKLSPENRSHKHWHHVVDARAGPGNKGHQSSGSSFRANKKQQSQQLGLRNDTQLSDNTISSSSSKRPPRHITNRNSNGTNTTQSNNNVNNNNNDYSNNCNDQDDDSDLDFDSTRHSNESTASSSYSSASSGGSGNNYVRAHSDSHAHDQQQKYQYRCRWINSNNNNNRSSLSACMPDTMSLDSDVDQLVIDEDESDSSSVRPRQQQQQQQEIATQNSNSNINLKSAPSSSSRRKLANGGTRYVCPVSSSNGVAGLRRAMRSSTRMARKYEQRQQLDSIDSNNKIAADDTTVTSKDDQDDVNSSPSHHKQSSLRRDKRDLKSEDVIDHSMIASFLDMKLWKKEKTCCGIIFKNLYNEVAIFPKLLRPCACRLKDIHRKLSQPATTQQQRITQENQDEEEQEEEDTAIDTATGDGNWHRDRLIYLHFNLH
ncbi:SIN3-HDAC complex-associated factor [Fragariocoptes setiger]|uniref:SIN3-HDAC complex-associated factor n=1 Tax=Fragariocoptes setiger TaxID=1670756 RepID=A0ABQ7S7M8_9ACAR|nr:SIN3-HDAC complex-associated factor [Fragariocoptes setiger]